MRTVIKIVAYIWTAVAVTGVVLFLELLLDDFVVGIIGILFHSVLVVIGVRVVMWANRDKKHFSN